MSDFKAIETKYKGYRFRSRLEARWAVFFDALGTEWKYEDEGFHLPNGEQYLPDFWLPQLETFAEIKGKPFTPAEMQRCRLLAEATGHVVMMLDGTPELRMYPVYIGGTGKLENQAFASGKYRIDSAVDAARAARFEYGEAGVPVMPVPIELRPAIRGRERQQRYARPAEREIIRTLLHADEHNDLLCSVIERIGVESIEEPVHREIFSAITEGKPLSTLGESAKSFADDLLAEEVTWDLSRALDDAITQLHVLAMEKRIQEIDGLLPLSNATEKESLQEERFQIIQAMRAAGKLRYKVFRR